ncbi:hypothetical protein GGS21DRAFT_536187 [Xylaria nigripes]|nr:hypothetical protein GGS21DRAFT_536187 [Xylaria nigripes]
MAPLVQNTFLVIPDVPSALNSLNSANNASTRMSRRPMTTKQVKKAYQEATRGPKLSKAERRRQELFEQDRIRKEFEKERNQARARVARNKKKEKEALKRAERKHKGLPLVDVRPSQDTIARFVRANPNNTRTDDGNISPLKVIKGEVDERQCPSLSPLQDDPKRPHESQPLDDSNKENVAPALVRNSQDSSPFHMGLVNSRSHGFDYNYKAFHVDHAGPPRKKPRFEVLEKEDKHSGTNVCDSLFAVDSSEEKILDDLTRESECVHKSLTPPSNESKSAQQKELPEWHLPRSPDQPKLVRETKLLPSTQSFPLSNLDDFFPSPSQELREIFEKPARETVGKGEEAALTGIQKSTMGMGQREPIPIQRIVKPPTIGKHTVHKNIKMASSNQLNTFDMPFFSTQDLWLSSQDVKDIEENPLPPPKAQAFASVPPKVSVKLPDPPRPSPKPLFTSSCREIRYKYAIERSKTTAWESPSAQKKAREELDRLQALEDERLAAAAVESDDEEYMKETRDPVLSESRATRIKPVLEPHATRLCSAPKLQAGHTRPARPIAQRNTRTKSSYEEMLELLAKGPTQRKQSSATSMDKCRDNNKDKNEHADEKNQTRNEVKAMSASQETDYDCGEEWDDDLLRVL